MSTLILSSNFEQSMHLGFSQTLKRWYELKGHHKGASCAPFRTQVLKAEIKNVVIPVILLSELNGHSCPVQEKGSL